jgi:4-hydroxybenzoate polyprenyltransferase
LVVGWWFARDLEKIATRCPKDAFKVFLDNHWVGVIVLIGIISDFALR